MISIIGERFGRLVVVEFAGIAKDRQSKWKCACDCGGYKVVARGSLKSGKTQSCGCLRRESEAVNRSKAKTHGMSKTATYRAWSSMIQRCTNENTHSYKHYGARGVSVCEKWVDSFSSFYADMGECPIGMSLDRIDVNGNYEPGNCRWVDAKTQARNRRNNVKTVFEGKEVVVADLAEEHGIKLATMRSRVQKGQSPLNESSLKYLPELSNER